MAFYLPPLGQTPIQSPKNWWRTFQRLFWGVTRPCGWPRDIVINKINLINLTYHYSIKVFWVTSPDLHLVDMEWASSMVITLAGLEPKQKLLRLMNWSFGCILWPRPTSTWWTWGEPPPWLSPWWSWNQNKSCSVWWTDHFDLFFDHVRPPPSGLGVLTPSTELV